MFAASVSHRALVLATVPPRAFFRPSGLHRSLASVCSRALPKTLVVPRGARVQLHLASEQKLNQL
jgi:hypothetical protein